MEWTVRGQSRLEDHLTSKPSVGWKPGPFIPINWSLRCVLRASMRTGQSALAVKHLSPCIRGSAHDQLLVESRRHDLTFNSIPRRHLCNKLRLDWSLVVVILYYSESRQETGSPVVDDNMREGYLKRLVVEEGSHVFAVNPPYLLHKYMHIHAPARLTWAWNSHTPATCHAWAT